MKTLKIQDQIEGGSNMGNKSIQIAWQSERVKVKIKLLITNITFPQYLDFDKILDSKLRSI